SPLPQQPDDVTAPKSLNSEGESQSTAEQYEKPAADAGADKKADETRRPVPRDRYIAPEMANWTKVFRFGHMLLVPTNVNESKANAVRAGHRRVREPAFDAGRKAS